MVRPDGFAGPLVLVGAGQDRVVDAAGTATVVATGRTEVVIEYVGTRAVVSVAADPASDELAGVVGVRAGSGFRRALAATAPELVASGSLVHQLLDDVPPATLIAGSAIAREGLIHLTVGPAGGAHLPIGICAGWQDGGAMLDAIARTGVPLLGWGPPAPDLVDPDDPTGWHAMGALPPTSMRRRRLLDVASTPGADGRLAAEVRFRDSYWEHDGTETVVHEYGLHLAVDPADWTIRAIRATPGPLPAPECPSAAASAQLLVGVDVRTLRDHVRDELTGTGTCTHLNDVLRSLADLPRLLGA